MGGAGGPGGGMDMEVSLKRDSIYTDPQ